MRPPAPSLLVPALLALAGAARPALAAEDDRALSAGASYAVFSVVQDGETLSARGAVLALEYEHGLSDTLWFRGAAGGGAFSRSEGAAWAGSATIGLTYTFDVLKYVPHVGLGAGAFVAGGAGLETTIQPHLELGVGLDVLESRALSWGVAVRFESFASDVAYFTVGPRVTYRWGFF